MRTITDWFPPLKQPDKLSGYAIGLFCSIYFLFQAFCFWAGQGWVVLAVWAGFAFVVFAIFQKEYVLVLMAFIINSTSIFFSPFNVLSNALFLYVPVLMAALFFMKRLGSPRFACSFSLIILSVLVSSVYSVGVCGYELSSVKLSIKFLFHFLAFYAIYFILTEKGFSKCIHYHILSGVCYVLGVYVMIQTHPYWVPNRLSVDKLIHANQLSMYMELFFPIAFYCFVGSKRLRERLYWGVFTALFLGNILATYSKAGIITVMVCLAYYTIKKISIRKIVVVSMVIALLSPIFYKGYSERVSFKRIDSLISAGTRIELQKAAFKLLKENYFIFGIGLNKFTEIKFEYGFQRYLDPEGILSSHNIYLDFWMGMGLPGFLAFLYMLVRIVVDLNRLPLVRLNGIRCGLMFCIISFLIHGLFDNNLPESYLMISFFAILGFSKFLIDKSDSLEKGAQSIPEGAFIAV